MKGLLIHRYGCIDIYSDITGTTYSLITSDADGSFYLIASI